MKSRGSVTVDHDAFVQSVPSVRECAALRSWEPQALLDVPGGYGTGPKNSRLQDKYVVFPEK